MAITILKLIFFILPDLELSNGGRPLFPGSDVDDQLRKIYKYPLNDYYHLRGECCGTHLAVINVYISIRRQFHINIIQYTSRKKVQYG